MPPNEELRVSKTFGCLEIGAILVSISTLVLVSLSSVPHLNMCEKLERVVE